MDHLNLGSRRRVYARCFKPTSSISRTSARIGLSSTTKQSPEVVKGHGPVADSPWAADSLSSRCKNAAIRERPLYRNSVSTKR